MFQRSVIRAGFAVVLAGVCTAVSAQIFECTDANGKLEFTQKCAPGTVKQREVANTRPGEMGEAASLQTSYKDEEQGFRRRQIERESVEAKAQATAAAAEKRCKNARARLSSLETARRVSAGNDPKTGERRYLDDSERS